MQFSGCRKLTVVRLPAGLGRIPQFAFEGCDALVEAALADCESLAGIGKYAFAGCAALRMVMLPPVIEKLGSFCFLASGVNSVVALDSDVDVRDGAFMGCPLLETVRFSTATLGQTILAGSECAKELSVELVKGFDLHALGGSGIESLAVGGADDVFKELGDVLSPAQGVSFTVNWGRGRRERLWPMTNLIVSSVPRMIEECHRSCLATVDLSCLVGFPPNLSFEDCCFLRRVRLPSSITQIPPRMFSCCYRLEDVNLDECGDVKEICENAFLHCWKLRHMEISVRCCRLDLMSMGISSLDLSANPRDDIVIMNCVYLGRLILHRAFRGRIASYRVIFVEARHLGGGCR
jgi:hypothetical protein